MTNHDLPPAATRQHHVVHADSSTNSLSRYNMLRELGCTCAPLASIWGRPRRANQANIRLRSGIVTPFQGRKWERQHSYGWCEYTEGFNTIPSPIIIIIIIVVIPLDSSRLPASRLML